MFLLINSPPKTAPTIPPTIREIELNGYDGKDSISDTLPRTNTPSVPPSIAPIAISIALPSYSLPYPNALSAASIRSCRPLTFGSLANRRR